MGKKIKAQELKNASIQFISFVDRGSNGRPFSFVKSENENRVDIKNIEKMDITEKDKNVFKKIYDFLFTPVKTKKEEVKVDKVLEALGVLSKKIDSVSGRLEKLENQEIEDKKKENTQDNPDTNETSEEDDANENLNPEVLKAITELSSQVQGLVTRVEKIEKIRKTPRSNDDIGNQDTDNNVSVFKGIFS